MKQDVGIDAVLVFEGNISGKIANGLERGDAGETRGNGLSADLINGAGIHAGAEGVANFLFVRRAACAGVGGLLQDASKVAGVFVVHFGVDVPASLIGRNWIDRIPAAA